MARRDFIIQLRYKTGISGVDSPEKQPVSKVYAKIKQENDAKIIKFDTFMAKRTSGKYTVLASDSSVRLTVAA